MSKWMDGVRDDRLYQRVEVKRASQYDPGPYLSCDFGVSAELRNTAVVDFWVELSSTDTGWDVIPSVSRHDPDEDGSHTERELGNRTVPSAKALPAALLKALRDLRGSIGDDTLFR